MRALERIQQELLVLLQHSSQSNTSIDGGGAATGDSTIQVDAKDVEERGRAYGLLLSATMMKGCKMPDKISKMVWILVSCTYISQSRSLKCCYQSIGVTVCH